MSCRSPKPCDCKTCCKARGGRTYDQANGMDPVKRAALELEEKVEMLHKYIDALFRDRLKRS